MMTDIFEAAGQKQLTQQERFGPISFQRTSHFADQVKAWRQDNTPIEGMMYDFEGKLIYATEYNLVILDKDFTQKIKEIRSMIDSFFDKR